MTATRHAIMITDGPPPTVAALLEFLEGEQFELLGQAGQYDAMVLAEGITDTLARMAAKKEART